MKNEDYLKDLGNRIRKIRLEKKLTQVELSDRVGIEDSALRRIESGRVNSTINMLRKIAKGLEIDVNELLSFEDKNES